MFHKRLLSEFEDKKTSIWGMVLTQWVMLIANVTLMLMTAELISAVIKYRPLYGSSVRLLLALIIVLFIRGSMSLLSSRISFKTSEQVKSKLRSMIYEKLMNLGSSYKKHVKTSEAVQLATEGVEQLEIYFGKYVPQFFYSLLAPVTLFVVVGSMSLKVAFVLLCCVPLIPISIVMVQKFAKKMLSKYWGTYTEMGDSFLECLQGLTTLKIYQADKRYAEKMDAEAEKFRKITMRVLIMQLNSISVMDFVAYGGAAAGIILSILEYQNAGISLAQCFFIIMISAEFFLPLRLLGSFFHIAMNGNAAADKIFTLLDIPEEKSISVVKHMKTNTLSFDKVNFSYEKNKQTLSAITFEAVCGMTALVGKSGCGKSTISALIMGDLKADDGVVKIGGVKQNYLETQKLRRKITRISHDSYLFAGTVRENLKMGNEAAAEEDMSNTLKQVSLFEFCGKAGLDKVILEKASNLSGGQRQRLALARGLLHNSDIYILDEATSNVDVESENDIMEAVRRLAEKKTVILISHRLANVIGAHQIYVLRDGRIVEHGQHELLYKKGGYYQKLFQEQSELEQCEKEAVS